MVRAFRSHGAMVILAVASCLALMLVGTDAQSACAPATCPSGYTPVSVPNYNTDTWQYCAYTCATPAKPECFPRGLDCTRPANAAMCNAAAKAAAPYVCGGTDYLGNPGRPCPSVACAYSSTWTASASGGCSFAKANIDAIAISKSNFNLATNTQYLLKQYCTALSSGVNTPLQTFADAAASATAQQIVNTLAHYSVYLCQCACGTLSAGYGVVKADIQSVANATAAAWVDALAITADCNGDLLAYANQLSEAVAIAVETAIDSVYFKYVSQAPGYQTCSASGVQTKIQYAVAKALVCVYAQAFAAAANAYAYTPGVDTLAYACGTSISVSGSFVGTPYSAQCPITYCDCSPKAQGYNNTGFETGVLNGNGANNYPVFPQWSVQYQEFAPLVLTTDNDHGTLCSNFPTITPSEGNYFAKVVGTDNIPYPGTNSISTTISVPPCASKIAVDWIFKCNDGSIYPDHGVVTITATNVLDGSVYSNTATASCSFTGTCGITGTASVGYWTTLAVLVPTGDYTVQVQGAEINDQIWRSDLYLDNLRYTP